MKADIGDFMPPPFSDDFRAIAKPKVLPKGDYFIWEREVPRKFAFVQSGLFRYVYIDQKGIEYTKGILPEGSFISSYSAMINESPSHFFIEALEPAAILEVSHSSWCRLREQNCFWDKFLVKLLEKGFSTKEKRERELLLLDAETRYRNFLTEFPQIEHRISQRVIASYLGIHPESLSRIRKKGRA